MKKKFTKYLLFLLPALWQAGVLQAAHYKIVKGSRLECTPAAGQSVLAKVQFGALDGNVDFDHTDLKSCRIEFKAHTKNIKSADNRQEDDLKGTRCFNAALYPDFSFRSDSVVSDRPGAIVYQVYGRLEAGGIGRPAKIQLTAIPVGGAYTFRGSFDMKLTAYGMTAGYAHGNSLTFYLELRTEQKK